jgi:nucleotide-binding universal stress UspA family protein
MTLNERISFERILCPIGLIPGSDEALRYAAALAKAFGAKLTVMHCTGADAEASLIDRSHIEETLRDSIEKHLRLDAEGEISAKIVVVEGDPQDAITREAARRRIDLIVMRSRRRPFAAALLGSTAESICRTAPCPVLVTHSSEVEWAGATNNSIGLKRVLVAYDFSSDSELALSYGLSLAQEYQAELHLIHVLPLRARAEAPEIAYLPFGFEPSYNETASRLNSAVPGEARLWCAIKQAVREGLPYREVLAYAEEQDIDLICMGASGTGFGMQALFGSNADRVLRQAACPVLIARPLRPMIASPVAASA